MQYKDYYEILGVARDATAEDIKKAFRRLARRYHPDVSKEPQAELRMQEINEANTVLSDPEKRAAYDRLGRTYAAGQDFRPPPGWEPGFSFSNQGFSPQDAAGFSDFFAELFGRMGTESHRHDRHTGFRDLADDYRAKVLLDLEDSYSGSIRNLALRIPRIDGTGRLAMQERTLRVKIPKGIRAGQVIRLAGQGVSSVSGGKSGDLLLEVEFKPHRRFRIDGADLRVDLPITPWEAALGAVIPVPLPDGSVKVRIPEGAQSGRQLRLRGRGIPCNPPGDLLLDIQVVVPPAQSQKARQLYETMARELAFDPRREWKG